MIRRRASVRGSGGDGGQRTGLPSPLQGGACGVTRDGSCVAALDRRASAAPASHHHGQANHGLPARVPTVPARPLQHRDLAGPDPCHLHSSSTHPHRRSCMINCYDRLGSRGATPEQPALLCTLTPSVTNSSITFTVTDENGQSISATTSIVADVKYVSLGDSYAAGEGNPPFVTDSYNTTKDGCHRSVVAASRLLGATTTARFVHVACSGAVVSNLSAGKNGETPQFNALDKSTSLVTMSIGGNDVGFSDIVTNCALNHGCGDQVARARSNLDNLTTPSLSFNGYSPLEYAYRMVRAAAPNARIVVTGYPLLFPEKWSSTCGPFTPGDTSAINAVTREGDRRIALTAQAVGADYVDLITPFSGHSSCEDRLANE